MLLFAFLISISQTLPISASTTRHCYDNRECPLQQLCQCEIVNHDGTNAKANAIFCTNITNPDLLIEHLKCTDHISFKKTEILQIKNATFRTLNLTLFDWTFLKSLSVIKGNLESVIGFIPGNAVISSLNFSANEIQSIDVASLKNVKSLRTLDLSHNYLSELPSLQRKLPGCINVDISNNAYLVCHSIYLEMDKNDIEFFNVDNSSCLIPSDFHWFNSTDAIPLSEIITYHRYNYNSSQTKYDCPKTCSCKAHRLEYCEGNKLYVSYEVNCTNKQLTHLPERVPRNTVLLDISNNLITSLEGIRTNKVYDHLRELLADNNQITSIESLDGSYFLKNFVRLSLRNNSFHELNPKMFANIFDRLSDEKYLRLGFNRLKCDCYAARLLRLWLLIKSQHITDYHEIYCEKDDRRVIDLHQSELCPPPPTEGYADIINLIIGIELGLLAALIAKLLYDRHVYTKTGRLPWPSALMPKLPWDFVWDQ